MPQNFGEAYAMMMSTFSFRKWTEHLLIEGDFGVLVDEFLAYLDSPLPGFSFTKVVEN